MNPENGIKLREPRTTEIVLKSQNKNVGYFEPQ